MKYFEYDSDGWAVGWHEDENRPNSTPINFNPIPPAHARFVNGEWIDDPSRYNAILIEKQTVKTKEQQAKQLLKNFNKDTATATDVKNAIAAILILIKDLYNGG